MSGGLSRLVCFPRDLIARQPIMVAYGKSGAWNEDDADAAFWRAFFADKPLRLPAGTWRITASLRAKLTPDCSGPLHSLDASVTFVVAE
jgi:hypothetical protein